MNDTPTPFAIGIDVQADAIEVLSGRNGSRLIVPAADWDLLIAVLRDFDLRSPRSEKPCLDLAEGDKGGVAPWISSEKEAEATCLRIAASMASTDSLPSRWLHRLRRFLRRIRGC